MNKLAREETIVYNHDGTIGRIKVIYPTALSQEDNSLLLEGTIILEYRPGTRLAVTITKSLPALHQLYVLKLSGHSAWILSQALNELVNLTDDK